MNLPIFTRKAVERLHRFAFNHPQDYEAIEFKVDGKLIKDNELQTVAEVEFDPHFTDQLVLPENNRSVGMADAENALIVFQELRGMTPRMARDERIWTALCHLNAKSHIMDRHVSKANDEKKSSTIHTRFFCKGKRGFERDNALARLWWWAFISSKVKTLSHAEALKALLELTDVRDSIVGRPTTSTTPQVVEAMLLMYLREKERDPDLSFFRRSGRTGPYRELLKLIDRNGGRKLYDSMSVNELTDLFWSLREQINENSSGQ